MGSTEVDEGCEAGTIGIYCLCVEILLELHLESCADYEDSVVAVYGVLFLDWQTQGNPDNPPFQGVR